MISGSAEIPQKDLVVDPATRRMLRVKQGDTEAFSQLVDEFRERVVGIIYHLVGNADEAEDLAQEVFLRVFRSREKYEPTAKFSTWLFTIVNNLARNAIRDRHRRKDQARGQSYDSGSFSAEGEAAAPSGAMPSRIFAKVELSEIVRFAVMQLSDEQRMAVMLNKFEGMNYKQIADVMNKSEMAVKSLLARARHALRETLQPYLEEGSRPTFLAEEGGEA